MQRDENSVLLRYKPFYWLDTRFSVPVAYHDAIRPVAWNEPCWLESANAQLLQSLLCLSGSIQLGGKPVRLPADAPGKLNAPQLNAVKK
jgi:hypothetical protein